MKQETRNKKPDSLRFQVSSLKLKSGQVLIITIIFLTVILILSTSLFTRVTSFLRFGSNSIMREQAVNLAEAGIDKTLWQLNQTGGTYSGETNTAVGTTGTFTVTVADKSPGIKTITATGYVPSANAPKEKQVIKVDTSISTSVIAFRYAVQVGTGGVNMSNSASINGNVYSNKLGPDSILGSGQSAINGDAYAVGTISTPAPTVTGRKFQNQQPSQMPTLDYQQWKDAATAGGVTTCPGGSCDFSGSTIANIGPQKYVGSFNVSNSVILTMQGPVYITGNLTLSNSAKINLDNSFGSNGTVLIVDGTVSVSNNATFNPTSANPKGYILVVSTSSSDSAISLSNHGQTAVFYALSGGAQVSNQANATALVANSLSMSNQSQLDYDSGLASSSFSTGPGGSWTIRKGTYHFK